MNGMSEREYSTHAGLSRGAVQNAKRGGRLVFYADGSINAAASDLRRADMADPDPQRRAPGLLDAHVRAQLEALADLRVSRG